MVKKSKTPLYTDTQIRQIMLQYFYDKNKNAKSLVGKKDSAANSISVIRKELKQQFGLTQTQVVSNLTYLLSQGWVDDKDIGKSFATPKGAIMPVVTKYYIITAAGIDKIDGPTEFTRDRFSGIKIEATGQNIITLGDGNQINAKFKEIGNALNDLKQAVKKSEKISENEKVDYIVDIESIQDQLAKPEPNRSVINALWTSISRLATIEGLIQLYNTAEGFIHSLLN